MFRLLSKLGLRDATILENNIVQTAGSAGESIAFGIGVTTPAILILGFGTEGQATYEFIRQKWPRKHVTIADRQALEELNSSVRASLQNDTACTLQLGTGYLAALSNCEVIIKTPGIPAAAVREALARNRNTT